MTFHVVIFLLAMVQSFFILLNLLEDDKHKTKTWYRIFVDSYFKVSGEAIDVLQEVKGKALFKKMKTCPFVEWQLTKKDHKFTVRVFSRTWNSKPYSLIEFRFPTHIQRIVQLDLSKRTLLEKVNDKNLGDYPEFDETLSIKGDAYFVVRSIMTDAFRRRYLSELLKGTNNLSTVEVNRVKSGWDAISIMKTCNFLIEFIDAFSKIVHTYTEVVIERVKNLTPDTQKTYCIICWKHVIPDKSVTMPCCEMRVHSKHLSLWLSKDNRCPYCKTKVPYLIGAKLY